MIVRLCVYVCMYGFHENVSFSICSAELHNDILQWYFFIYKLKNMRASLFNTTHTHTHTHLYIYIYIYIYLRVGQTKCSNIEAI